MEIIAKKREIVGKSVKNLRYQGLTPAVIIGKGLKSIDITINKNDFIRLYNKAGETTLIDLKIEGLGSQKVLVKDVTYNPVTDILQHVTFYKPNLKEKITANIPLEFINKDLNPLIKNNEAVLITLFDEVEVTALPADLPHSFEIDVSNLTKIGDGITVEQITIHSNKVEITNPELGQLIVKLDYAIQEQQDEVEVSEEEAILNLENSKETSKEDSSE